MKTNIPWKQNQKESSRSWNCRLQDNINQKDRLLHIDNERNPHRKHYNICTEHWCAWFHKKQTLLDIKGHMDPVIIIVDHFSIPLFLLYGPSRLSSQHITDQVDFTDIYRIFHQLQNAHSFQHFMKHSLKQIF